MAKVIILTGAGISAQSGISTFRDTHGLWENHNIKDICTAGCLESNYQQTINFYDQRRLEIKDKLPNKAHKKISQIKSKYPKEIAVITQNIDDLFEKAHCQEVIHLHGFLKEVCCMTCDTIFTINYKKQNEVFPFCPKCNGKIRPNIVFFNEPAPQYELLHHHIQDCEMIVVIGTSGKVIGVNTFAQFIDHSILNNLEPSDAIDDTLFSKVLYKNATDAIDEIIHDIEKFLS